jgi:hypothetical protein
VHICPIRGGGRVDKREIALFARRSRQPAPDGPIREGGRVAHRGLLPLPLVPRPRATDLKGQQSSDVGPVWYEEFHEQPLTS